MRTWREVRNFASQKFHLTPNIFHNVIVSVPCQQIFCNFNTF